MFTIEEADYILYALSIAEHESLSIPVLNQTIVKKLKIIHPDILKNKEGYDFLKEDDNGPDRPGKDCSQDSSNGI
jgi:hypothetical protein